MKKMKNQKMQKTTIFQQKKASKGTHHSETPQNFDLFFEKLLQEIVQQLRREKKEKNKINPEP